MLASTCSIRRWIEAWVKFLSRAFTALNLLPSMAATAWANRPSCRHRAMNWRQVPRIAGPFSFLKSAMVLKSGDGIHVQARLEEAAQCLLVIIGATPEGKKELVGLIDGVRESAQSWKELLLDLKRR